MFPWRKKKQAVTTEPLVPETPFARDDVETGRPSRSTQSRAVKIPPARKHFVDFPPQWRERQCIMTTWTYYSISTLVVLFLCWPGAVLGVFGGSIYTCRCCMPKKGAKGMKAAFCIHVFAFAALCVDLILTVVLVALGTFYLIDDCPYTESLCDFRSIVGLVVYGASALVLIRCLLALNVFLSMRDYRREIHREDLLEKRLAEEIEERFKEYQKRKATKKKSKREMTRPDVGTSS